MQKRASAQDSGLAAVRGGAVHIRLQTPDFTHRSFMDLRLLGAPTDSAVQVHWRNLPLATRLTLGFFNRWLRGTRSPDLENGATPEGVRIEHWPAHKH